MMYSRKPDLKAPRFRNAPENSLSSEFISFLKEKDNSLEKLPNFKIKEIVKTFNQVLCENVISNRDGVELPEAMGKIFIGSCKKKKHKVVNFKATAEMDRVVQHNNFESDGFLAKIFYSTYELKNGFRHHEIFGFKACRRFTRSVSEAYVKNWNRYIQINENKKISGMFRQTQKEVQRKEKSEILLKTYDEFEF